MNPCRIGIIGGGVVGAAIAYELAQIPGLEVTVLDSRSPQTWEATGAALGVLMAAMSQKRQGRALGLRLESLRRYETLIPELEALIGKPIPYNQEGLLRLCFEPTELARWQSVQAVRAAQGFPLEIMTLDALQATYPDIATARAVASQQALVGAVYSPGDRQVHPVKLTQALIEAGQQQGVRYQFETFVRGFKTFAISDGTQVKHLQTDSGSIPVDWVILAAGLGSKLLSEALAEPVAIQPVLGQALQLRCTHPLPYPHPVISGEDVHLVPLSAQELWVGATVEFSPEAGTRDMQPDPGQLQALWQQAIALCPSLADATVVRAWSGLRPRPVNQPAPLIGPLTGYANVLLATGHYRNGVLLAPITALKVRELIAQRL